MSHPSASSYAILMIFPSGAVRLSVRRPRRRKGVRRHIYRRPSTASLKRLAHLVEDLATYTGYALDDPHPPFVAILDLPH